MKTLESQINCSKGKSKLVYRGVLKTRLQNWKTLQTSNSQLHPGWPIMFIQSCECFVCQVVHIFLYFSPTDPRGNAPKQESGTGDAPPAGEDEEKKKQKRGTFIIYDVNVLKAQI